MEYYEPARVDNIHTLGGVVQTLGSISLKWLVQINVNGKAEIYEDEDVFEIFDGRGFEAYDVIFATDPRAEVQDQKTLMMVVVEKNKRTEGASNI